jgi:hypothetical protein
MPIEFLKQKHPINRINPDVLELLSRAQKNTFARAFPSAHDLGIRVLDDLKLDVDLPAELADQPPTAIGELSFTELSKFYLELLKSGAGITGASAQLHAVNLSGSPWKSYPFGLLGGNQHRAWRLARLYRR